MSLDELITEGELVLSKKKSDRLGFEYVDYEAFDAWKRKALMFLQAAYPQTAGTVLFCLKSGKIER